MSEVVDCIAYVIRKAFWSLWVFLKFVFRRICDLLGLAFNILACLTLLRFPVMVQQFMHMNSMWEWRFVGIIQLLIFISDIPFIIMGILMTVFTFGFVLIPFVKELRKEDVGLCDYFSPEYDDEDDTILYDGFTLRRITADYFFKTLCDIFCFPMAVVCLCSWRCVIFVRKFRKTYKGWSSWKWRAAAVVELLQLLVDIPCILLGIILLPTWRFPFLVRRARNKKWNAYRLFVFPEACLLIIDLFCFVAFLFTVVTWRGPFLVSRLYRAKASQWEYRRIVFEQAGLVFVDIPCILCAAIVFITLWRIRPFINNLSKNEWKIRRNCFVQLGMLFVDFTCLVIGVVVVITLWRFYPLVRDIKKYSRPKKTSSAENEQRMETADARSPDVVEEQELRSVPEENQTSLEINISYTSGFKVQTWKIRKAILKHFLFLFIDIPAIVLCFLIIVTVVRLPKLLSKLIQSGDFYMEFAITVYFQAGKLIIDVVFICLFVVLMILRPIQSWVHLLEDEKHKKNRLLRFYVQFVPEILSKRLQMYRELEEMFSNCLKNRNDVKTTRYRLSLASMKYLGELQWIRDKLKKHELDEEYSHVVHLVYWWEAKRAHKLSRLYSCELNYLAHPHVATHNRNLLVYRNEMVQYESEVQQHCRQLQNYVLPKVPLWTEQTGLMTRSRKETQRVLIKCLPSGRFLITTLILLNLLFLYRFPTLVRNLWGHWYNRRKIVFASTKEYLYDFVAILQILIVLILIYRAPFLITDIIRDVFYIRSWRAVRETAKRYPPWILDDLVEMMKAVFSWKSVRFIVTTLLFGLFMPAEIFLTAVKLLGCNKCFAFLFTGILYIIFVGFPFLLSFYLGGELLTLGFGSELNLIVGIFGAILVVVLAVMAISLLRNPEEAPSVQPVPYDYLRFNWSNMHVIVFEIVEYLQLLALVFTVADLPMVGAQGLQLVSRYLLMNFASFQVKLWITFVLFLIWFFCVGAPVIFEQILNNLPQGTCAKNIGWTLVVSLLGNTLFVTMVESLISMLACNYKRCEVGNSTDSVSPVMCSGLYDEPNLECWTGKHQAIAFFGLFGLVWYATTSIIFGTKYGDVNHPGQDFAFSPVYNTFVDFIKVIMVGMVVLAASNTYLTLIALLILNILALVFTVVFQKVFAYPVSNSFGLTIWRSVGFLSGMIAAFAAILAKGISNPQSWIPLIVLCVCIAIVLLLALIFSLLKKLTTFTEEKRKTFRLTLLKLEKELIDKNQMVNSWSKQRKQWRRVVKNVYEAQSDGVRIKQGAFDSLQIDVVTDGEALGNVEPEASDKQPPLQQDSSTVDLPPPPSYDELFPNIKGKYDVLPEHPLPPDRLSSGSVKTERAAEEQISGPKLDEKGTCTITTEAPLPGAQSEQQESAMVPTAKPLSDPQLRKNDTTDDRYYNAPQIVENFVARDSPDMHEEFSRTGDYNPVTKLECNGRNLLLLFEHHVHYSAFSFAFISQLSIWRREVRHSNWVGLLQCLQALEASITGSFNSPTYMDLAVGNESSEPVQELCIDPDNEVPPTFTPEPHDPESIRAQSEAVRLRAIKDISTVQDNSRQWVQLLDSILPTIPVIRMWLWTTDGLNKEASFQIHLRRPVQGTVTEIGPKGIKMAKGATIALPKRVIGSFVNGGKKIKFAKGFEPKGKKGPISVSVSELGILTVNSKLYITAQDKRLPFEKALDSIRVLNWK